MPSSKVSDWLLLDNSPQGASSTSSGSPGSMKLREMPPASPTSSQNEHTSQSDTSNTFVATSGQHRDVHNGSISGNSNSDSDLYSEGESEGSDNLFERPGSMALPAFPHSRQRHRVHESSSRRGSLQPPSLTTQSEKRGGGSSSNLGAKRIKASSSVTSASYFSNPNVNSFDIRNEVDCCLRYLRHLYKTVEEDRLPWMTDFADIQKMGRPRKIKEIAGRLNLNIPYYSSNYVEIFYAVTMPLLLLYNKPFFIVTFLTIVVIHSIRMHKKKTHTYGDSVVVLGRPISYRNLGHLLVFALVMLLFFNGLRTLMWVLLLNFCIIVPHALIRKPTYFDDEDLEKCRPKMAQYAICLIILVLAYLEGDTSHDEEAENRRAVERERKRMAQVLAKRESTG
ncbi:PRA1_family_protein [Leishmania braziliensis MHOM/BR/75/M2904]|nr:PRA1_family_protein [Leishmania braziliensis MHOM/BR/75/M2904]